MLLIITLIVVGLWLLFSMVEIVPQNTVYVVEWFGKFERIMVSGLNFRVPFMERVAEKVTLKQQNFAITGRYPSHDKLMINVIGNLIFEVIPTAEGVSNHVYKLVDRERSVAAALENALRTYIASQTSQQVLEKKEGLIQYMKQSLGQQFKEWGINILDFQLVEVNLKQSFF